MELLGFLGNIIGITNEACGTVVVRLRAQQPWIHTVSVVARFIQVHMSNWNFDPGSRLRHRKINPQLAIRGCLNIEYWRTPYDAWGDHFLSCNTFEWCPFRHKPNGKSTIVAWWDLQFSVFEVPFVYTQFPIISPSSMLASSSFLSLISRSCLIKIPSHFFSVEIAIFLPLNSPNLHVLFFLAASKAATAPLQMQHRRKPRRCVARRGGCVETGKHGNQWWFLWI